MEIIIIYNILLFDFPNEKKNDHIYTRMNASRLPTPATSKIHTYM